MVTDESGRAGMDAHVGAAAGRRAQGTVAAIVLLLDGDWPLATYPNVVC
jgi:hypothetical protein